MNPPNRHPNSFGAKCSVPIAGESFTIFRLAALEKAGLTRVSKLPFCIRALLENVLRREDGSFVTAADIEALARWSPGGPTDHEIAFFPARILLQDFTGVPVLVDLATMRDAAARLGADPGRINPVIPVDLVIDHSVQVDSFGSADSLAENLKIEYERNRERYAFMRWGAGAFRNFRVVPPSCGIVHQINVEHLTSVVHRRTENGETVAYPDSVLGTDSHTTMVNGLGVLGWGVGGIEAESAMLGHAVAQLTPEVVGMRLHGILSRGVTATDLVLTITEILRRHGVVGKFVEFHGPALATLSLADRATIANMAPEYGATIGFFPVDERTIAYLKLTGRRDDHVALVEAYCKEQGLFCAAGSPDPEYSSVVDLDIATVEPSLAGPKRPHDRIPVARLKESFSRHLVASSGNDGFGVPVAEADRRVNTGKSSLGHGSVVIAAITSCTNTSNPDLLVAAGLLARNAVARGLAVSPTVKTSLAPGSRVVTDYLSAAGLLIPLEQLKFNVVGYGCTTCIGNSGPLPDDVAKAIKDAKLVVASVLSGNRNFEGRINPLTSANYLASPQLVVAYAIAGRIDIDLTREPLGHDSAGRPVYLADVMPDEAEVKRIVADTVKPALFQNRYADAFQGDDSWNSLPAPKGNLYAWDVNSTYIKPGPYFDGHTGEPPSPGDIVGARPLAILGNSVTTDHISPAGDIPSDGPAGKYLLAAGVEPDNFNSFGSRRGNHEVMIRGTFANIRLRNLMTPDMEGGVTLNPVDGSRTTIYEAAEACRKSGTPLIIIAGKEYGTGSSRDWAAKGTALLGVKAVIAESFERIHRNNLAEMGVLPLEFLPGQGRESYRLTGSDTFDITGVAAALGAPRQRLTVKCRREGGERPLTFEVTVRLDTRPEIEYYRHGGILPSVLRGLS